MADDDSLFSPISAEIFFDGLRDLRIDQDVFRCTLFSRQSVDGEVRNIEAARLTCPAAGLPDLITQIVTSLTSAARVLVRVKAKDGH